MGKRSMSLSSQRRYSLCLRSHRLRPVLEKLVAVFVSSARGSMLNLGRPPRFARADEVIELGCALLRCMSSDRGTELPVLKPSTCMPGIYGEADTDLECRGV